MSLMNYGFTKVSVDNNDTKSSDINIRQSEMNIKKVDSKVKSMSPQKKNTPVKNVNKMPLKSPQSPMPIKATKLNSSPDEALHYSPFSQKGTSELSLPPTRVKMIMKSCPDVEMVPHEPLHVITKATEMFIQELALESLKSSRDKSKLDYESLSNHIHSSKSLEFLKETIPRKLTFAECQRIIAIRSANKLNECL